MCLAGCCRETWPRSAGVLCRGRRRVMLIHLGPWPSTFWPVRAVTRSTSPRHLQIAAWPPSGARMEVVPVWHDRRQTTPFGRTHACQGNTTGPKAHDAQHLEYQQTVLGLSGRILAQSADANVRYRREPTATGANAITSSGHATEDGALPVPSLASRVPYSLPSTVPKRDA